VGFGYPTSSREEQAALYDVSLQLGPGLTVLTGDSGSGKSTLLRLLNGLIPHFHGGRIAGTATVAGLDVLRTPTRQLARHVGFVFQDPEVGFVRGTVAGEVAFGPENLGVPAGRLRAQVADALDAVGVGGLAGRRVATLSGGERQRVALAAALATSPGIVAFDEPCSQLDEAGAAALAAAARSLAARGSAVIVAEHRPGRFPDADRLLGMAGGRISEPPAATSGAPDDRCHNGDQAAPVLPGDSGDEAPSWSLHNVTAGPAGVGVVADVDLAGTAGEIVALTGPNGGGKTTLLRTIAGLLDPLAGSVERRSGRIAYLPQDPGILLHRRTVRAEIEQTLRWSKTDHDPSPLLHVLGLAGLAERDPRDLSGGQRQRAALAAVLVGRPALAVLDEPTRGMDAAARHGLRTALRDLAAGGTAIVVATHDAELAAELADRVVDVRAGQIRPASAPRALVSR
jgi:energy-coupling factor transport system ATP-binding protein